MKKGDLVVRMNAEGGTVDHGILLQFGTMEVFGQTDRIAKVLFHKAGMTKVMMSSLKKTNP